MRNLPNPRRAAQRNIANPTRGNKPRTPKYHKSKGGQYNFKKTEPSNEPAKVFPKRKNKSNKNQSLTTKRKKKFGLRIF